MKDADRLNGSARCLPPDPAVDPDQLRELGRLISGAKRLVFFGGAGVSTASGIPDYRSMDGLFRGEWAGLAPEEILSHTFFMLEPERFFSFYRQALLHPEAQPNRVHRYLRELELAGRLGGVVTQNIDGLHRAAGTLRLFELHGSVHDNECMDCGAAFPLSWMAAQRGIPRCPDCGGVVRPLICLYGEPLNPYVLSGARRVVSQADVLVVAGTSLLVEPAASLLDEFSGSSLVVINRIPLPIDPSASLIIRARVEEVLGT